jgi:tRNA pseudouridine32 synthase/23S rRNA pseudouridine746 synthase
LAWLSLFVPLSPQPPPGSLPARLRSPFDPGPPHPLAREAAERLQRDLIALPAPQRDDLAKGKMLGVLIARDAAGNVGVSRAFAGMLGGRWDVDGFVGPVFDLAARNALWPDAEAELRDFASTLDELTSGPRTTALRAQLKGLMDQHAAAGRALKARHEVQRRERRAERAALLTAPSTPQTLAGLSRLSGLSRADRLEGKALRAAQRAERAGVQGALRACELEQAALRRRRADRSTEVLEEILAGYQLSNARGEVRPVKSLFAPDAPPGGAGDCAGPKLFAHAQREGLQPLALAEFWWGAPAKGGAHHPGEYYPSCRPKCGAVLEHMLRGWPVEPETESSEAAAT